MVDSEKMLRIVQLFVNKVNRKKRKAKQLKLVLQSREISISIFLICLEIWELLNIVNKFLNFLQNLFVKIV